MKNKSLFIGIILCCSSLALQAKQTEYVEHENVLSILFGNQWEQDQYLSPLLYSGLQVGISNEWWQPFRTDTRLGQAGKLTPWKHTANLSLSGGWKMFPSAKSNAMADLSVQTGWGACYQWKWPQYGLQLYLGPYIQLDAQGRYHYSSFNKPYSMDLSIDAQAMAGIGYQFGGKKSSYRLQYQVRTNLIGVDFMPDYWQSYYEISQQLKGTVRCAGMWNHRYLFHQLSLDMRFTNTTWRLGIRHEYLEYGSHDIQFSREQVMAVVGAVFSYKLLNHKDIQVW